MSSEWQTMTAILFQLPGGQSCCFQAVTDRVRVTSQFSSSFPPNHPLGQAQRAFSLPRTSSSPMAHLCRRSPVLPWQKLFLWCSVSTQIPLFGSLPLSGVQLGQAFSFFIIPFGYFSRFLLIHPYSCLLFTQCALLTKCDAQQALTPGYKSLFLGSLPLFLHYLHPTTIHFLLFKRTEM